jgi:hypothetical protein
MKLICIFRNSSLLEQSTQFSEANANVFKDNVAFQTGHSVESLDAVMFDDEEIKDYLSPNRHRPRKRIAITKTQLKLIDIVDNVVVVQGRVNWRNCNETQLNSFFSPEERSLIQENKDYFNSLGVEKFHPEYIFDWPHEVLGPEVDMQGKETSEVVYKTINAVNL